MIQTKMQNPFNDRRLYEFDLNGFVVFPGFLAADTVASLNAAIDAAHGDLFPAKFPVLNLGPAFLDLLSNDRVLKMCEFLLGDWFRFDHAYGLQGSATCHRGNNNIHAGPYNNQGSFHYSWRNGRPRCGLIVFTFVLEEAAPGAGGLVFVPGSHKHNMDLAGRDVFATILGGNLSAWWVHQPALKPGDLLLFTEATAHGTKAWCGGGRRRNLYYKYCSGHECWRGADGDLSKLARTDVERKLLRPPFVGNYGDDGVTMSDNHWRAKTNG